MTSVVLFAGFLMLTFSGYRMEADMGLMVASTIGVALTLDFLLLPTLLITLEKGSEEPVRHR